MSTLMLKELKVRFSFLVTALALCTYPFLGHAQVFKPDDKYSLDDYQVYGMIFYPHHREVVEGLVQKLLKLEQDRGYRGGTPQEKAVRTKAKKYYALFRGVYPASTVTTDDSEHAAQKVSSEYLANWYDQMPKCTDQSGAKAQAEKEYRDAVDQK
jgi:hypothetical protein